MTNWQRGREGERERGGQFTFFLSLSLSLSLSFFPSPSSSSLYTILFSLTGSDHGIGIVLIYSVNIHAIFDDWPWLHALFFFKESSKTTQDILYLSTYYKGCHHYGFPANMPWIHFNYILTGKNRLLLAIINRSKTYIMLVVTCNCYAGCIIWIMNHSLMWGDIIRRKSNHIHLTHIQFYIVPAIITL